MEITHVTLIDDILVHKASIASSTTTRETLRNWADMTYEMSDDNQSGSESSANDEMYTWVRTRESSGAQDAGKMIHVKSDTEGELEASAVCKPIKTSCQSQKPQASVSGNGCTTGSTTSAASGASGASRSGPSTTASKEDSYSEETQISRCWNRPIHWGIPNPFPNRKLRPVADHERTSVVIRQVPTTYTREMVATELDKNGFAGAYNFLYMPYHFESGTPFGWVFVNLVDPKLIPDFWQKFDGYDKWEGHTRASTVNWTSTCQGLRAHVEHYRNSTVMHKDVPDEHRPVLLYKGMRVVFPPPAQQVKAPPRYGRLKKLKQSR